MRKRLPALRKLPLSTQAALSSRPTCGPVTGLSRYANTAARGKTCELLIGFRLADGSETAIRWEYGSDSPEPPREVREFVLAAVECTNPWYRRQIELRQQRARRPKSEGWRLVSLWPTVDASMENSR